jgi:hypothetical protein
LKIQKTEKGKAAPLPPHSNLKENTQFASPSGFFSFSLHFSFCLAA